MTETQPICKFENRSIANKAVHDDWRRVPESFQASDQGRTHRSMAQTEKGYVMGIARYEIVGMEGAWRVRHDGTADNSYATKEAAFEAAIAAASLAIRQGHEVIVTAPASETATGSPAT